MKRTPLYCLSLLALLSFSKACCLGAEPDLVLADFEGTDYGDWAATGEAFGNAPAQGTLPHQMAVDGFLGHGLVNSFHGGDDAAGTLTSPKFTISRKFISFLVGGGGFEGRTCMNLLVEGKIVRSVTGPNTEPGGSERLTPSGWDVSDFAGKTAQLTIVDAARGGWGHIEIDQIVQTDTAPPLAAKLLQHVRSEILAENRWLHFPVKTGGKKRAVIVSADGKPERRFEIELADAEPDWQAPLDISAWKGRKITVEVDQLPEGSKAMEALRQSDEILGTDNLYSEILRPQFHFSARRGWLNDPNGLVFFNGEYHLFFQHNPYGWNWGNMHWGHATSRDLVHWTEHGEALYPDEMGPMFSGSAVVDWKNTSGFGKDGKPPLVLIYTAAGNPAVQALAYSTDGRTFAKYSGNPVIKQITGGNRDPKVMWHEPSQRWVMALYVALPDAAKINANGKPAEKHTIHFFSSPDLKAWTLMSVSDGFFECPDLFELPVDGDASKRKWVLTAASSDYEVGSFDGARFVSESGKIKGHQGRGFYAAQTFSDLPDQRRIQIGWLQAPSPGMAFNQAMSLPLELSLRTTADGPRLAWQPVKEMEALRAKTHRFDGQILKEGDANPLAGIQGDLFEIRAEFRPGSAGEVAFNVRGMPIVYDVKKQELSVNGHRTSAPLQDGKQRLVIYADRTAFEVFASDSLVYVPMPVIPKIGEQSIEVNVKGGQAEFSQLDVFELKSGWK